MDCGRLKESRINRKKEMSLPIPIIDKIITMAVKTSHQEKLNKVHKDLCMNFGVQTFDSSFCSVPSCIPLFMYLNFIGEVVLGQVLHHKPAPVTGSSFYDTIYQDYKSFYEDTTYCCNDIESECDETLRRRPGRMNLLVMNV